MERLIAKLICIKNNKIIQQAEMNHYIYLLREREFIKTNEQIFKIGKTTQEGLGRFKNYPTGSELILHIKCMDCHSIEKQLLSLFRENYKHRSDIGAEYFEGDYVLMMKNIIDKVMYYPVIFPATRFKSTEEKLWDKFQRKGENKQTFEEWSKERIHTINFDKDYEKLSPLDMLKKYTYITDLFIVKKDGKHGYLLLSGPDWHEFEDSAEETLDGFIEYNSRLGDVKNYHKRLQMLKDKAYQVNVDRSRKIIKSFVFMFDYYSKNHTELIDKRPQDPDKKCVHVLDYREAKRLAISTEGSEMPKYPKNINFLIIDFKKKKIRGLKAKDMYKYDHTMGHVSRLDFTHLSPYECTHENNNLINPSDEFRSEIHEFINLFINDIKMFKNIMYDIFDGKKGIYYISRRGNNSNYGMYMLIYNLTFSLNIDHEGNLYHMKDKYKPNPLFLDTLYENKIPEKCSLLYDNIGCKDICKYSKKYLVIVNDNGRKGIDCNYEAVKDLPIVKNQKRHNYQWDDMLIGNGIMAGILWWLVDNYDR